MAREEEDDGVDPNAWMATFSDLLSLLLTFFVLLFAMKSVDKGKLEETLGYFRQGGIGILESGSSMPILPQRPFSAIAPLAKVFTPAEIKKLIEEKHVRKPININRESRGMVISISSALLFSPGQASLRPEAEEVLDELAAYLKGADYKIQIEGHTDNIPIHSLLYKSNWDLSIARSGSVVRYLLNTGELRSERFSIVGYGDRKPIFPNNSLENRAKNRRVELVLLK